MPEPVEDLDDRHLWDQLVQAVAEMLVKNETRIKFSSAITGFKHPRQLLYSFRVRLQVSSPLARIPGHAAPRLHTQSYLLCAFD